VDVGGAIPNNGPDNLLRSIVPKKERPYLTEPESIAREYTVVEAITGERRYYEDWQAKHLVMIATDRKIVSMRDDLRTIRAMLELAEARGWHSVEIKGSPEFQREAWVEATARGLQGRGYTPSDGDVQEADRRSQAHREANKTRAAERVEAGIDRAEAREDRAVARRKPPGESKQAVRVEAKVHEKAAAGHEKKAHEKQPGEPPLPTMREKKAAIVDARKSLSDEGQLVLAGLQSRISREVQRTSSEMRVDLGMFAVAQMVELERRRGPVVLSNEQKQAATAPPPAPEVAAKPVAQQSKREQEAPRRRR